MYKSYKQVDGSSLQLDSVPPQKTYLMPQKNIQENNYRYKLEIDEPGRGHHSLGRVSFLYQKAVKAIALAPSGIAIYTLDPVEGVSGFSYQPRL